MTLARGRRGPPSSPTFWAAFSKDLSSWSTGAHSPRAASARSFCTASLLLAPADPGLLPGCGVPSALAPPPVLPDPSSPLPVTGLSSLLEAFFLSSFVPPDALLLFPLLLIARSLARPTPSCRAPHFFFLSLAFTRERERFSPFPRFSPTERSIRSTKLRDRGEVLIGRVHPRDCERLARGGRTLLAFLHPFVARNQNRIDQSPSRGRKVTVT